MTINNWGHISGGSFNDESEFVGNGISMSAEQVSNITIKNYQGATITGGNFNFGESFVSGAGIILSGEIVNDVAIGNLGLISGGYVLGNDGPFEGSFDGAGIAIDASFLSNILIYNGSTGVITGGPAAAGIDISGEDPANVSIINFGTILGGNGYPFGTSEGGPGIIFVAPESNENIQITNFGFIKGGNGFDGDQGGAGIAIEGNNTTTNNWGVIAGGTSGGGGSPQVIADTVPNTEAIDISGSGNVVNLNGHSVVLGKISMEGLLRTATW